MPYRNPQHPRHAAQKSVIQQYAGQTALWHKWASATTGNPVAGLGRTDYFQTSVITGVFGGGGDGGGVMAVNYQGARPGGQIGAGNVRLVTDAQINNRDEGTWQGVRYRAETDAQPTIMASGYWMITLTRAGTGRG